ncbi:MAG: endonuclease III [bacterium]|nr:MAG: endonuclease III [bacterium]
MEDTNIHECITILRDAITKFKVPIVTEYAQNERNPFHILISTVLSLRTKDKTTAEASKRLLNAANDPEQMQKLSEKDIEKLIYPVGFYRVKSQNIKLLCQRLVKDYGGRVPDEIDELLKFKGVGRKTANLVVTLGYNKPGICVDIHVHRITNRWGYVQTKNPEATEIALRAKLPSEHWIEINDLLVTYGQNLCTPVSPKCSQCKIIKYCDQKGVDRSR